MANLNGTNQYLDFAGLGIYDGLIKQYINTGDAAIRQELQTAIGEGGNVAEQIAAAINNLRTELKGTLEEGDSATISAINDELDALDSAIATLNGDNTTAGSVAKAVKDGIESLDYTIENHTEGKPVVSVSQSDGVINVTEGNVKADYITVDYTPANPGDTPVSATSNVQASLNEIYNKIALNAEAGEVSVWADVNGTQTKVNEISEFGKTYTFKQGLATIATLNLAKDMVVSGGSVITATSTDAAIDSNVVVGEKYIKLNIANSLDVLYIPVNSLYKDHTVEQSASKIQLAISNDNVISANVVAGSIEKTDLTTTLQNEISAAATVVNAKSTGHVRVAVTAANGANPAEVTVSENDIASADDLAAEITRAQSAETAIDGAVGLTKGANDETRSWSHTTNYYADGNSHTVKNNMEAIDGKLKNVSDIVDGIGSIPESQINGLFSNNG